ncbi:hypothetical protein CBL_21393, partial [Carabus blaptoides fortunei]
MMTVKAFKIALRGLLAMLGNRNIVFLTILPMPAVKHNKAKQHRISQLNGAIKKLGEKNPTVQIVDLHCLFASADAHVREEFFEQDFTHNPWRAGIFRQDATGPISMREAC